MTRPMCQVARASRIWSVPQNWSGTVGGVKSASEPAREQAAHRAPVLSRASRAPQRLQYRPTCVVPNSHFRLERFGGTYLDLVGHPDWPKEKLSAKMRGIRQERAR